VAAFLFPMTSSTCPSCDRPLDGNFCAHCGEKRPARADHTLKHFLGHLLEAFTHADGKIFRSLRLLLTEPGRLTADHLRGKRKPHIPPLQLFLLANLVFFLLHPLIGSNTLTTDLNTQLHYTWHHAIVESLVAPRLALRALTVESYAAIFDPAAITLAKSLVILVVPVFSLAVMAFYWRQRRNLAAHLTFSLHFSAVWLLMLCLILALTNLFVFLLGRAHVFPSAIAVSGGILGCSLALMSLYLFRAARAVYLRESWPITAAKALAMSAALLLSLQAYRFALFFLTFWST
jgi:hypothetical protein